MKKIVCLFLVISLVLACSGSAFAAPELATASALSFRSPLLAAVAANDGSSSSSPLFVSPTGGMTYYFFNGTQVTSSSTSGTTPSFEKLFSALTTSFANSISGLSAKLYTPLSSILSFVNSLDSSVGNIETYSNNIKLDVSNIRSGLTSLTSYVDDLESILNSGVSVDFTDLLNKLDFAWPWGFYSYYIEHPNVTLGRINSNGNYYTQSVYTKSQGWFGNMMYWMVEHVRNMSQGVALIEGAVLNSSDSDFPLYDKDMIGSVSDKKSLWFDVRAIGSNLSYHLSRLSYVLANDEDIEARDASASVRSAYTNDFLKPSGSASASASDFGTLASGSTVLTDSFQSSYGASDALGALSDQSDGRWDWFSQTTMDNLNSSGNRSNSMLKSNRGYTNFYDERYRMINHD